MHARAAAKFVHLAARYQSRVKVARHGREMDGKSILGLLLLVWVVLGIPLGYFLACHGLLIIAFVTVAVFVNRQDAIDHWHGAHEDI